MNVSSDTPYYIHVYNIPYFLEFFLWVLLISECANMRVQFEGRNNTRSGAINIATLRAHMCAALVEDSARGGF